MLFGPFVRLWRWRPVTARQLMAKRLMLIVPPCFFIGVGMEAFMIKTGFYTIATRKEAERRAEAIDAEYEAYRQKKKQQQQQQQQQTSSSQ